MPRVGAKTDTASLYRRRETFLGELGRFALRRLHEQNRGRVLLCARRDTAKDAIYARLDRGGQYRNATRINPAVVPTVFGSVGLAVHDFRQALPLAV
jgi:hypothetical protein